MTFKTLTSLPSKWHTLQKQTLLLTSFMSFDLSNLLLFDRSAAYDLASHKTLLSFLISLGTRGTAQERFAPYLEEQSCQVA